MFVPDTNWIPLREVAVAIAEYELSLRKKLEVSMLVETALEGEMRDIGKAPVLTDRNIKFHFWSFCEKVKELAVTSADGRKITASKSLLIWDHPTSTSNQHFDMFVGTIGSSQMAFGGNGALTVEQKTEMYGPFLYLPLIIRMGEFSEHMEHIDNEEKNESPSSQRDIARQIVDAFDRGIPITKTTAKQRFGRGVSVRNFMGAWAIAGEQRPAISKPGRRPGS